MMAHRNLFKSLVGRPVPASDAFKEEGAPASALTPRQQLAQYAATGCLNAVFYASADEQLERVLKLCEQVEPDFIARTALYARQGGHMKEVPALLCAVLAARDTTLLANVFPRVIDNARMLRNFVRIVRSGVVGRRSLGSAPKRLVREWLEERDEAAIFRGSVGRAPSLADIVRMVHPKPQTKSREALYGYLVGGEHRREDLPELVRRYESFKDGERGEVPDVPFQMLTPLGLGADEWAAVARRASWQMTRVNLNTFARQGVFDEPGVAELLAERLSDPEQVRRARVFPYQLMTAYESLDERVPAGVRAALEDALDVAVERVPAVRGKVYICPDVSASMLSPVTRARKKGSSSAVRVVDVAALFAAAVLRKNPRAEVIPFEQEVVRNLRLNPRDSVMTNARKLASVGGGGTNCAAPLALLNEWKAEGDLVIFISDKESWADERTGRGTAMMGEWGVFRARNPSARLVCLDVQPYATAQAQQRADVLNIGGFSDQVFDVIAEFASGRLNANHWVGLIEEVRLFERE